MFAHINLTILEGNGVVPGFSLNKGLPRRGTGVARQEYVKTVDGMTILYSLCD
jgi:hypothetical protein